MATICKHHVLACMEPSIDRGLRAKDLLIDAGINPAQLNQEQSRVHTEQAARLFAAVQKKLDDELMGMSPQPLPQGFFACAAELCLHCPTLQAACEKVAQMYRLCGGVVEFSMAFNLNTVRLNPRLKDASQDQAHFMSEFLFVTWHRFFSWLIARPIELRAVDFRFAKPKHADELKVMFPCAQRFEQRRAGLCFDRDWLEQAPVRDAQGLAQFLADFPREIMTLPGAEQSLEAQVQQRLRFLLDREQALPSLPTMAAHFGHSAQRFYRQLNDAGRRYGQIKNDVRRELAMSLLQDKGNSVEQVAERCGFNESRSFTRAFGQWTGLSPRAYRRRYSSVIGVGT